MGKFIELTAGDGHKFAAFVSQPSGKPRGGVVVIPEIFGVNSHIQQVTDGFAADGYVAVAPAMFDRVQRNYDTGYSQPEIQAGVAIMQQLKNDQSVMDVDAAASEIAIAVVGAHLSGEPLNHQLTERGGRLLCATRTAPCYRLYALPGGPPARPGMVRDSDGQSIELEVWALDAAAFGSFTAAIPPPLAIGTVALEDGSSVKGFLCETHATREARDISSFGGWRAWLRSQGPSGAAES